MNMLVPFRACVRWHCNGPIANAAAWLGLLWLMLPPCCVLVQVQHPPQASR